MPSDPNRSKSARWNARGARKQISQSRSHPVDQGASVAAAKRHYERYIALAREAASAGDPIEAENFYQHAEHYLRTMREQGRGGRDERATSGEGLPTP